MPELLPNCVVLDHRFALSAPTEVKVASAIDAVCQAIESLLSKKRTPRSIELAMRSLALSKSSIGTAIKGDDGASRRMLEASNLAGRAIAITRTGVPHALSYVLSSEYGIPHGIAVATTMEPYLRWVQNRDPFLSQFAHLWPLQDCWKALIESINGELLTNLEEIRRMYGHKMLDAVNFQRLQNAAIPVSHSDLSRIINDFDET